MKGWRTTMTNDLNLIALILAVCMINEKSQENKEKLAICFFVTLGMSFAALLLPYLLGCV
jgi:uncharacterized membrane protein YwaF